MSESADTSEIMGRPCTKHANDICLYRQIMHKLMEMIWLQDSRVVGLDLSLIHYSYAYTALSKRTLKAEHLQHKPAAS